MVVYQYIGTSFQILPAATSLFQPRPAASKNVQNATQAADYPRFHSSIDSHDDGGISLI